MSPTWRCPGSGDSPRGSDSTDRRGCGSLSSRGLLLRWRRGSRCRPRLRCRSSRSRCCPGCRPAFWIAHPFTSPDGSKRPWNHTSKKPSVSSFRLLGEAKHLLHLGARLFGSKLPSVDAGGFALGIVGTEPFVDLPEVGEDCLRRLPRARGSGRRPRGDPCSRVRGWRQSPASP